MNKLILMIAIAMTTALSANYIDKRKERARQWYKSKVAKVKGKKRDYQRYLEHKLKNVGRKATKHLEKAAKEIKNDEELRYALYDKIQEKNQQFHIHPQLGDWIISYSEEQMGFIEKLPIDQQKFLYSQKTYQKLLQNASKDEIDTEMLATVLDEIPDDLSYFLVKESALNIMHEAYYLFPYGEERIEALFDYIVNSSNPDKYIDLFFETLFITNVSHFNTTFAKHPELLSNPHMLKKIKLLVQKAIILTENQLEIHTYELNYGKGEYPQEILDIIVEHFRETTGGKCVKISGLLFLNAQINEALEKEGLIRKDYY